MKCFCVLLCGLGLIFCFSSLNAQSNNNQVNREVTEEGAAQVWNRSAEQKVIIKKAIKKPVIHTYHQNKTVFSKKRTFAKAKNRLAQKKPSVKKTTKFKKKRRAPRLLGKRLRSKDIRELPPWLIDLNLFTVGIFFLIFFGGVVGLYFLLRPDILLSFYQLLLLAAAFSGTLFWYLILGTEQGFDMATWKFFFKHGWLSFPLIFGIYFGFRLLFNSPLTIAFPQLLLIGFLIGLGFLLLSFIINWY